MSKGMSFVLVVGDDEKLVMAYDRRDAWMRDIGLNFESSPNVGVVYEVFDEDVKAMLDDVRAKDMKAGVYSTLDKAQKFMFKALAFSEDGTMVEPQVLASWGGET